MGRNFNDSDTKRYFSALKFDQKELRQNSIPSNYVSILTIGDRGANGDDRSPDDPVFIYRPLQKVDDVLIHSVYDANLHGPPVHI